MVCLVMTMQFAIACMIMTSQVRWTVFHLICPHFTYLPLYRLRLLRRSPCEDTSVNFQPLADLSPKRSGHPCDKNRSLENKNKSPIHPRKLKLAGRLVEMKFAMMESPFLAWYAIEMTTTTLTHCKELRASFQNSKDSRANLLNEGVEILQGSIRTEQLFI